MEDVPDKLESILEDMQLGADGKFQQTTEEFSVAAVDVDPANVPEEGESIPVA